MTEIKKKYVKERIEFMTLKGLIEFADGVIEKHPEVEYKDFVFEVDHGVYDDEEYAAVSYRRDETLTEAEAREAQQKSQLDSTRAYKLRIIEQYKKELNLE